MISLRWRSIVFAFVLLISRPLWANTIYSSAVLNEASGVVDVVPAQARQLVQNFLEQRDLIGQTEQSPNALSRDDSESRTRSPGSTIDALRILSKAEYNLHNPRNALLHLEQAEELAAKYQLPYLLLDVRIDEIQLRWQISADGAAAREGLELVEQEISQIANPQQFARGLQYRTAMLRAAIASQEGQLDLANQLYLQSKEYVDNSNSDRTFIRFHTTYGQHLLAHKQYNQALSELLASYWKAIEVDSGQQLAEVNQVLGQLFFERRVLDKAADHLSQAADFYDNFDSSPRLAPLLKRMGDIYYQQGKYNLALVHYFNAMDHEKMRTNIESVIDIRLSLATTYLNLVNYPLAEQYLERAQDLLQYTDTPRLKAHALLLEAGLARHQKLAKVVLDRAFKALAIGESLNDITIRKHAFQLLYYGYELSGEYKEALEFLKQFNSLSIIEQQQLDIISEDAFRQQKEFVEQSLHLAGQKEELIETHAEYLKFQKITVTLFVVCALLFIFLIRRGHVINVQREELDLLNELIYTHSRSGLKNLRMLNAKLPASLEESSHKFEKWHVGELIHEPLNDRLRFVMIDVPFLRNMYLQHGYAEGLKLEKAFGDYLHSRIESPARIYHFSDANLLYIEPASEENRDPERLFERIQQWICEFEPQRSLNRIVRIGMADYPFLPRAYTAVNDKELIDVLLMSTSTARTLSMKEHSSQWVYLKAIENAPAASLATGNIRKACKHSINQGLIKVHSSFKNEDSIKKLLKDE